MTPKEFEIQLHSLLQNAPKESTVFFSYSHPETKTQCEFIHGSAFNIIANLSILLTDREDLQKIFMMSVGASEQDFAKEFKRSLK